MSEYNDPFEDDLEDNLEDSLVAVQEAKPKLKRPSLYRVLLLNDDYTTMDFVVMVLKTVFNLSEERAAQIMLHVHQKGVGICGVFTREIAETKVDQVMNLAKQNQHPLQCTMEPDSDDD